MPKFVQGDLFEDLPPQKKPKSPPPPPPEPAAPTPPIDVPVPAKISATQSPSPANVDLVFLGWDRPFLDAASEHLIGAQRGQRLVDLSDLLVVVPTQHAGRRLREALAAHAAEADGAVVPPMVVPPEFLISPDNARPEGATPVAGRAQVLLTWADLLRSIELDQFRALFPVDPVERSFNWAIQTAGDLLAMRRVLGESGLSIATAADVLAEHGMEPLRWRQLTDLERRAERRLANSGMIDIEAARREAASCGQLPPEVKKIVVLGTPDPTPLAIDALRTIATHTPVEIAIHAPETRANHFDNWGRPVTKLWLGEQIAIPEPLNSIHLGPDPAGQAEIAAGLLARHDSPAGFVAIGAPDDEVIAPLGRALADRGIHTFDPAGEPFQKHEIFYLLRVVSDLLASRSHAAFAQLIRIPEFARAVAVQYEAESGRKFDHLAVLRNFDTLHNQHLPDTLDHTRDANTKLRTRDRVPEQSFTLTLLNRWLNRFDKEVLSRSLPEFLAMVYAHREFDPSDSADRAYAEISETILELLEELESPLTRKLDQPASPGELLSLLLQLVAPQPYYPERESSGSEQTIDLQGWLELLWEDAPHLIVTGFNEGKVPEAIIGDAYLPNQARAALGLRDNDTRMARDIYLLTAMLQSRQESGRIDLVIGKTASDHTPLSPSRLLFLCPDEELPMRARQLFAGAAEGGGESLSAWQSAWKLAPPELPEDAKIRQRLSVTQFTDYLRCPFRFFLKHGLRMEEFDRKKLEMDFRDFGNQCHDALEKFGHDTSIRESTSEHEISNYLIDALEDNVHEIYGGSLPVPIMIQLESAKQRLDWAARIQARERANGWQIIEVEWSVPTDDETGLPKWQVAGMPVAFKIDRIDRHEQTGQIRVLDYKTSDKADSPADTHLEKIPYGMQSSDFPDWSLTAGPDGWPRRWVNLQLPMYIFALREHFKPAAEAEGEIVAGLFKLPRALSNTKIDLWHGLDSGTLASAKNCAVEVVQGIRGETFWPPAEKPKYDDFKKLFFEDGDGSFHAPPQKESEPQDA